MLWPFTLCMRSCSGCGPPGWWRLELGNMRSSSTNRITALGALGISTLGWTFAPIFIRLLRNDYEPLTQGFLRYAFGASLLIVICLVYHRGALFSLMRNPTPVIGISILNSVQQYAWTSGTYGSTATTAQLIVKLSIVFVVIFAFLLFREERAVIRNPLYLFGTALSLIGVAGVLIRDPNDLAQAFTSGNMFLLFCALSWAVYAVWGKHIVGDIHPLPMFAVVASLTAICLGAMAVVFEEPSSALHAGIGTTFLVAISGITAIGGAHPSFHYAQKHFGSAFTSTFMLIVPLTTYIASLFILPGEGLSVTQGLGALILMLGTLLIIVVENRKRLSTVDESLAESDETASPSVERAL